MSSRSRQHADRRNGREIALGPTSTDAMGPDRQAAILLGFQALRNAMDDTDMPLNTTDAARLPLVQVVRVDLRVQVVRLGHVEAFFPFRGLQQVQSP